MLQPFLLFLLGALASATSGNTIEFVGCIAYNFIEMHKNKLAYHPLPLGSKVKYRSMSSWPSPLWINAGSLIIPIWFPKTTKTEPLRLVCTSNCLSWFQWRIQSRRKLSHLLVQLNAYFAQNGADGRDFYDMANRLRALGFGWVSWHPFHKRLSHLSLASDNLSFECCKAHK